MTELFTCKGVHYLSGAATARWTGRCVTARADVEFAPADYRALGRCCSASRRAVMTTVTAPPDDGWCSLSLHAGGTIDELRRARADPDRLLIVEASDAFPRTYGLGDKYRHALHVDEIDILVRSRRLRSRCPAVTRAQRWRGPGHRAENAVAYMPSGSPCTPGIGSIPNQIATLLAEGRGWRLRPAQARGSPTAAAAWTGRARSSPMSTRASSTASA